MLSKVIVFAWVNDEETKRAYESGQPPDDWNQLLLKARAAGLCLQQNNIKT